MQKDFLKGEKKHIGKLGNLLKVYEEEREAERVRAVRRELAGTTTPPEEEEEETESEEELGPVPEESEEEKRRYFERMIRERFIYGLLPVSVA